MDNETSKAKTSPLMWMAGIAITVFCATGVAAIMGWIPASMGQADDKASVVKADKPAAARPATTPSYERPRAAPVQVASIAKIEKCADCGVIESTKQISTKGAGSGLGAVGGAVVGGLLGNQVGGGRGQDVATVAGVVGGGLAGNEIEKRMKATTSSEVTVRMEDGSARVIQEAGTAVRPNGDRVRVVNGVIRAL